MTETGDSPPCPNPECRTRGEYADVDFIYPKYSDPREVQVMCCACGTCGGIALDEAEARRLWAILHRAPRWTSEPPTMPGREEAADGE